MRIHNHVKSIKSGLVLTYDSKVQRRQTQNGKTHLKNEQSEIPKKVLKMKSKVTHTRVRTRSRWKQQIRKDIAEKEEKKEKHGKQVRCCGKIEMEVRLPDDLHNMEKALEKRTKLDIVVYTISS
jgi:hypothetical protein